MSFMSICTVHSSLSKWISMFNIYRFIGKMTMIDHVLGALGRTYLLG